MLPTPTRDAAEIVNAWNADTDCGSPEARPRGLVGQRAEHLRNQPELHHARPHREVHPEDHDNGQHNPGPQHIAPGSTHSFTASMRPVSRVGAPAAVRRHAEVSVRGEWRRRTEGDSRATSGVCRGAGGASFIAGSPRVQRSSEADSDSASTVRVASRPEPDPERED